MKKIKLFALALMATFSLSAMAVDPDLSINDQSQGSESFLKTYETQAVTISSSASFSGGAVQLGNTPSSYDQHYLEVLAANNAIDSISFLISGNGSNKSIQAPVFGWAETATSNEAATYAILDPVVVTANSYSAAQWFTYNFSVADVKCLRIYRTTKYISSVDPEYASSSTALGSGQTIKIYGIKVWLHPNCEEPATALDIVPAESGPYYVGNTIHFSLPGGNGSAKALTLDGVAYDYLQWLMEEGEHTFTVSQDLYNGICGGSAELTINVLSQTPVASCSIDGPATGVIGAQLTYTATAANATDYEWYVDGVAANTNAATFVYTAASIGSHSIYATASNTFTATPVASDPIDVEITKVCGELIKGVHTGDKTATVSGVIGGTIEKNTQGNGKLGGEGHYWKLVLAEGNFVLGDTVIVNCSAAAGQGTLAITTDKEGTTQVAAMDGWGAAGDNILVINNQLVGNTIYLSRTASNNWNGTVASIAVHRACEESDNANISKAYAEGMELTLEGTTFSGVVPASVNLAQVIITYDLEHPFASGDPASGFVIDVPNASDPANTQDIVVTAENGNQKTYTISISKAAEASHVATLSSLSVAGYTLSPEFATDVYEYSITKAFGAASPTAEAVSATPTDPAAHPHTETIGDVQLIVTVTAEDESTTQDYIINILTAEAPKTLERVLFANGFDAFIDNAARTVKAYYMAGEAAPEAAQITAGSGTAGPMTGNTIGVTGADMSYVEYTVTLEEVTPYTEAVAADAAAGVFDGTEAWVKTGILESGNAAGFSGDYYVIRRQKKGSDPADDQRVFAGYVRAYLFVGNASELQLTIGSNKAVKYAVDGGEYTEDGDGTLNIALEEGNHLVEIVSNQQSGDGRISAPKLVERGSSTALDEAAGEVKARKIVRDGQIIIVRGDKEFNIVGAEL